MLKLLLHIVMGMIGLSRQIVPGRSLSVQQNWCTAQIQSCLCVDVMEGYEVWYTGEDLMDFFL